MAKPSPVDGIGAETPLPEAARRLLAARLGDVRELDLRLAANRTAEAIHDLRVATRRLRAALAMFGGDTLAGTRREVKRLGRALGDVRDLDLQVEWLAQQPALRLLLDEKRARLHEREAALHQVRERFHPIAARLGDALATFEEGHGRLGGRPMRRRLRRRLRQLQPLVAEGIDSPDPRTTHRLRIAIKKLRYHAELLEAALSDEVPPLLAELVPLQELLGDLHDHDVRVAELLRWVIRVPADDLVAGRALLGDELAARDRGAAELGLALRKLAAAKRLQALGRALK